MVYTIIDETSNVYYSLSHDDHYVRVHIYVESI